MLNSKVKLLVRINGSAPLLIVVMLFLTWTVAAQTKTTAAPLTVKTYNEPGAGSVNSYWLITNQGIIVIDAQRTPSSAAKLVGQIQATGKPVIGIILTHPHPDHGRGLPVLAKAFPDAPVYYSQATRDSISADKFKYFPEGVPSPSKIIGAGEEFSIGGISFRADEIGAGESEAMTMVYLPSENILFSSDAISGRNMTPFLIEGRSGAWLKQLETLIPKYRGASIVYPGHGQSGSPRELIAAQREYLRTFRQLVSEQLKRDSALTSQGKRAIVREMERRFPNYLPVAFAPQAIETNTQLVELNVDAVAKELMPSRGTGRERSDEQP